MGAAGRKRDERSWWTNREGRAHDTKRAERKTDVPAEEREPACYSQNTPRQRDSGPNELKLSDRGHGDARTMDCRKSSHRHGLCSLERVVRRLRAYSDKACPKVATAGRQTI